MSGCHPKSQNWPASGKDDIPATSLDDDNDWTIDENGQRIKFEYKPWKTKVMWHETTQLLDIVAASSLLNLGIDITYRNIVMGEYSITLFIRHLEKCTAETRKVSARDLSKMQKAANSLCLNYSVHRTKEAYEMKIMLPEEETAGFLHRDKWVFG